MLFSIQIKYKIWEIYWFSYHFCQISLTAKAETPYLFTFRETTKPCESVWKLSLRKYPWPDISISIDTEGKNMVWYRCILLLFDTNTSFYCLRICCEQNIFYLVFWSNTQLPFALRPFITMPMTIITPTTTMAPALNADDTLTCRFLRDGSRPSLATGIL